MKTNLAPLRYAVMALVILGISFISNRTAHSAEPADTGDDQDTEVLTRGPVHEAFAGVVTYNPEPGVVVPKAPPANIEEVPPDEKPAGDNVAWIPGYWAWDDERADFLWVSGVWRALPPGRQWVSGYWSKTTAGFQWTSGYWADAKATETTYLPAPPATLEAGPSVPAPSPDYYWVPGYWMWYEGRFAWRPGYWVLGQADWDWCPAYYTWTPRGYVFVDGYWDYCVERRGVLFAPVYYTGPVYLRHGYYYSPVVVIDLTVFPDHLFIRPRYHHCYFGDYYAISYYRAGFYASFSFQSRRHGYDPIYAHRRWEHRHDPGWRREVIRTYQHRRDHEDARPPRTWAAETRTSANARSKDRTLVVATSYDQLTKREDSPVRYQPVAKEERQRIVQRQQEVVKSRDERRTRESHIGDAVTVKPGQRIQPSKARLPQSPIIAPSMDQPGDRQTPPRVRQALRPETRVEPKRETPQPEVYHGNRLDVKQPAPRETSPVIIRPPASRSEPAPTVQPAPSRREPPPEIKQPVRRESPPKVEQAPSRREPPPEIRQSPSRREPPPAVQPAPARREAPPAKEKAPDSGKGDSRGDSKGDRRGQDKGDDQQERTDK